jgi:Kef-type K+ transport system membrane component KefB
MALTGFIAGLIIPHKNGFAISLTEKLEDFVILLLIPIVRPAYQLV